VEAEAQETPEDTRKVVDREGESSCHGVCLCQILLSEFRFPLCFGQLSVSAWLQDQDLYDLNRVPVRLWRLFYYQWL